MPGTIAGQLCQKCNSIRRRSSAPSQAVEAAVLMKQFSLKAVTAVTLAFPVFYLLYSFIPAPRCKPNSVWGFVFNIFSCLGACLFQKAQIASARNKIRWPKKRNYSWLWHWLFAIIQSSEIPARLPLRATSGHHSTPFSATCEFIDSDILLLGGGQREWRHNQLVRGREQGMWAKCILHFRSMVLTSRNLQNLLLFFFTLALKHWQKLWRFKPKRLVFLGID